MVERVAFLMLAAAVLGLAFLAFRAWQRARVAQLAQRAAPAELLGLGLPAGSPAILYFTTAMCGICRLQQAPALQQLAQRLDHRVPVHTLDAIEARALADFYGVLTVPTTVVLDQGRRPAHINHGLATAPVLFTQVRPLLGEPE